MSPHSSESYTQPPDLSKTTKRKSSLTTVSNSSIDEESHAHEKYGTLHPILQQFDSTYSFTDDVDYHKEVDPSNFRTWFGLSDRPAFYTPPEGRKLSGGEQKPYPYLSYRQLHEQMDACPSWPLLTSPTTTCVPPSAATLVVGVLLPTDLMTEVAVVHLCIMSGGSHSAGEPTSNSCCSAPLDPRSSRHSLLGAMDQMKCRGLVTSLTMIEKFDLAFLVDRSTSTTRIDTELQQLEQSIADRMIDVRVIRSVLGDDGQREGSITWDIIHQSEIKSVANNNSSEENCSIEDDVAKASASINANLHSHPPLLLLRTSGTTSVPKLVPLTGPQLLHNARCQIKAMNLAPNDCTLNAMPLFHIGGMSCSFFSVLASGGSAIYCGSFEPERFINLICGRRGGIGTDADKSIEETKKQLIRPTWYNAVPTMHQAILFHAKSSLRNADSIRTLNSLRFVRSGAANLSSDVASGLESTFGTTVINSFALSECMPVCVQPLGGALGGADVLVSGPPVGIPVGPSLRIADPATGQALPHGIDGEICISGPGVIASYLNAPPSKTHTPDGWLRTGDVGRIDPSSCQVRITGRAKEMIKRGGEQVWPTTVDGVVQAVKGVKICVTFGVKNLLWGEEVAAAVVLEGHMDEDLMRDTILGACKRELDENAIPAQILFFKDEQLPKGPSGKYLRMEMAERLGVEAVDTGALRVIQLQQQQQQGSADFLEETGAHDMRIQADRSIDGIRILASIFVVMNHVGFYPTSSFEKLARFNISIPIFFILAAFQLSLSVVGEIKWSTFVGTRIGNLHSLFVITQLIALPSLLIFNCAGDSTGSCDALFYIKQLLTWFLSTLTGMFGIYNFSNPPSWFLTVIYQFMIVFPFIDKWARTRKKLAQSVMLNVFVCLATAISVAIFFGKTPNPRVNKLRWSIIAFFPTLFASMLCAYFFIRSHRQMRGGDVSATYQRKEARRWAVITDITSMVFLVLCVLVALSDCVWLPEPTVAVMRPDQPLSEIDVSLWPRMPPRVNFERRQGYGQLTESTLVQVCDVTYNEFVKYLHNSPLTPTMGRFHTTLGLYIGRLRMGTPIAMLWIYGLAKGHGLTAKIMRLPPLLWISPLTYHLYLLHVPIARFYWLLTREGSLANRQFWYSSTPAYPVPIMWWEVIILIAICLIIGAVIDQFVTPILQPRTVLCGNWICEKISLFFSPSDPSNMEGDVPSNANTEDLIKDKVQGLTGASIVTRDTNLSDLGLDSLGTTALLSIIRSATPLAAKLTIQDLEGMKTVGELVDFLTENETDLSSKKVEEDGFLDEEIGLTASSNAKVSVIEAVPCDM